MIGLILYRQFRHWVGMRLSYMSNLDRLRRLKKIHKHRPFMAIMLLEHLGDIVACEPVARHARTLYPNAFIVWMVKRNNIDLLSHNPFIDSVMDVHCLSERLLLADTGLFDRVFDLHFPMRYCSLCRTPRLRATDSPVGLSDYFRYGNILSTFAMAAGLEVEDISPKVYISGQEVSHIDSLGLPERFIAVNCTSLNPDKDWPREKWQELVERIGVPEMGVIEIGLNPILSSDHVRNLSGLSILASAEVIRRAQLFIGIDSGPAHLANAVGTPGVILMGSYLGFDRYMPFSGFYGIGAGAAIVRNTGSVADIPVELVVDAAGRMLSTDRTCHAV